MFMAGTQPDMDKKKLPKARAVSSRRERIIAVLIVFGIVLVVGWEIAAKLAARPFDELRIKSQDFSGFLPRQDGWSIQLEHTMATPTDPTVISYALRSLHNSHGKGIVFRSRIVHGYNMVDCMRIKQYKVELLLDTRTSPAASSERMKAMAGRLPKYPVQVWQLTSDDGSVSIWTTTMLRAVDFGLTTVDTRDMAFPRVGTPDSPSWEPTGIKLSSFRHPVSNLRNTLRARWNASRCDTMTFLRLRQPAWASDEMLTMVTEYHGPSVRNNEITQVSLAVLRVHTMMLQKFRDFWLSNHPLATPPESAE